jgi:hypothetical protein
MKRKRIPQPDLFVDAKLQWMSEARMVAARIALEEGSVTAEDVRVHCPLPGEVHKNTMGKIFSDRKTFVWNGVKKSHIASRKGGMISVWKLTNDAELQLRSHYRRKVG